MPTSQTQDSPSSRILIAEYDSSMLESLGTLSDSMLEIDFDMCTSRDEAIRRLLDCPYQVIISGVYLAELNDFLLIKQKHAHQRYTPLVVTAKASDIGSASQALRRGAFDVITNPLDPLEARATIHFAVWQHQLLQLITQKEQAVEKFHQHLADFPTDKKLDEALKHSLAAVEKTVAAYNGTVKRIEESLACFASLALDVQNQARERALKRLNAFRP